MTWQRASIILDAAFEDTELPDLNKIAGGGDDTQKNEPGAQGNDAPAINSLRVAEEGRRQGQAKRVNEGQSGSEDPEQIRSRLWRYMKSDDVPSSINQMELEAINRLPAEDLTAIAKLGDAFQMGEQFGFAQFDRIVEHHACDPNRDQLDDVMFVAEKELLRRGIENYLFWPSDPSFQPMPLDDSVTRPQFKHGYQMFRRLPGTGRSEPIHEFPISGCG